MNNHERCRVLLLWLGGLFPAMTTTAQQPAPPVPSAAAPLVFRGVTVIDVQAAQRLPDRTVVIAGNRIQAIAPAGKLRIPPGARVVDGQGKYLIPGLWDMHLHPFAFTDIYYPLLIANGVTGFRDAASSVPLDTLIHWRQEVLAGVRVGPPRQLFSGPAIDEDPPCNRATQKVLHHTCVADAADARHLVDSLRAAGADMLKMYDLNDSLYFALAAEARRLGIPFGGHLDMWGGHSAHSVSWQKASESGAGIIDHINSSGGLGEFCWTVTDSAPERSASLARCQFAAAELRRTGTWLVPTALILGGGGDSGRSTVVRAQFLRRAYEFGQYFPDSVRNGTAASHLGFPGIVSAFYPATVNDSARYIRLSTTPPRPRPGNLSDSLGMFALAHRAGLPILAGTDASAMMPFMPPGFSLHAELAVLAAEGFTAGEVLQAATLNPAKFLHGTDSLGTVSPGKLADLVLLDADPLVDIQNTTRIRAVVADGRYFDRTMLDQMIATVRANAKGQP